MTESGGTTLPTSNTGGSTNSIDFTATAVGQKLEKNSALRSKIEAKLQAAGYTGSAYEAAYGFKNLGQFNAATNQVQNHGYPVRAAQGTDDRHVCGPGYACGLSREPASRWDDQPGELCTRDESGLHAEPRSIQAVDRCRGRDAGDRGRPDDYDVRHQPHVLNEYLDLGHVETEKEERGQHGTERRELLTCVRQRPH